MMSQLRVLSQRSPVFKAMIQGNTLEAKRGEIRVLDCFEMMLHYV